MEVALPLSPPSRSRLLLGALIAALLACGLMASSSFADDSANNYSCAGHVSAGTAEDGVDGTQVKYSFGCNGPILGYQIASNLEIQAFDTDNIVLDQTGAAVVTDSFTCNAFIPTWGLNCIGTYSGGMNRVIGQFAIAGKLCDEPRVDPLLTVVYATADAKGKVTQYISGPFDLGRPHGCPRTPGAGNRAPAVESDAPAAPTATTKSTKTKTKKATAKAKKAAARA
jgi:opacity protein-like surface antigen